MGIQNIQVNIELGNFSNNFYQYFEVQYKWTDFKDEYTPHRSGNPGYLLQKPIIIGSLIINNTKNIQNQYINVSKTNYYLKVPIGLRDGQCKEENKYTVGFGEDLRTRCSITILTNNFSLNSCKDLNQEIKKNFFGQTLINITDVEKYKIYVSKLGNITEKNLTNWNQILIDKLPSNNLTAEKFYDQIICSGLSTTIQIDIIHSLLPKPDYVEHHKILGVGITLGDEKVITWPKCTDINCTDILKIDLISYVKFHDISTPETYYYAGGPNLDISLPYDFFYPFLSGKSICVQPNLFILIIIITICTYY